MQYKNSWNYAVGSNYHFNEKWILKTGVGYDQTPSNRTDRNVQVPDTNRLALAVGTHFQASQALGFDIGWSHLFAMNTHLNNTMVIGDQSATAVGSVRSSADVYGVQMTWDMM